MRTSRVLWLAALVLTGGCQTYYNDIPSPDALMHLVPWFDAMIKQRNVHPYARSDIPRLTIAGTVPVTGSEGDWFGEWSTGTTTRADKLINPLAGKGATAMGDTLFHTYCAVCHGPVGAGDGLVGKKMAALSLLTDRARAYTDGYIYSIIRYGRGVMPRYGDKVPSELRWHIVNYVRQLQAAGKVP